MFIKDVTVKNQVGLHSRPATFFIQKANSYKSSIWVEKDDRRVNAKSLLGVLSLGIVKGMTITLIADGNDEAEALLRELMGISDDYHVLFVQGGASTQFEAVPLNLLGKNNKADYCETGNFASKAGKEAKKYAVLSRRAAQEGISVELLVAQEIERISRA